MDTSLFSRAVAGTALALLVAGTALPAAADDGKGGKGGKGKGRETREDRDARGARDSRPASRGTQGAKGGGSTDPAGNNGTVKIDGLAYDDGLGNEPHVTCEFRVKLYGFDDGQTGDVTIAGHAPSGAGVVSSRTGVLFSDDPAGGGPNDPDAIFTYTADDLDLTGLTPHPKQGYHLKLTLATGEPGGVKHKVFWLEPCAPEVAGETGDVTVPGTTPLVPETEATETEARVLGVRLTREDAAARVAAPAVAAEAAALPTTGTFADALLALGGWLVAAGAALVTSGRRRRTVT